MGIKKALTRSIERGNRSAENGFPHAGPPFRTGLENLLVSTGGKPWEVSGNTGWELYRGAMSIPAGWRGANLMSDLLAQVDWDAYTEHGRDQEELISPRPSLLEQPAPPDTRFTTFKSLMLDYIWHGNAVAIIATRDASGKPTSIWPVPAPWVGVRRITQDNNGFSPLPIGSIEYQIAGNKYDSSDILHIKGPCAPGALRGFGVLEAHLFGTLHTAHEQQEFAQIMARPGVPPGYLQSKDPDVTEDELDGARSNWMRRRAEGGVAALNSSAEFVPIAWNPDEMQMLEARQFTLLEMANVLGLPPSFLGAAVAGTSLTYSTVDTEALGILKFSMGGHFTQFGQTFGLLFPRGTCVRPDLDGFLQADITTRYNAYTSGITAGWLLRSEVRRKERLVPKAGIDNEPLPKKAEVGLEKTDPLSESVAQVPPPGDVPPVPDLTDAGNRAVSNLKYGKGEHLYDYYEHGAGSVWKFSPTPWTTLRDELIKNAKGELDEEEANGLATNLFTDVFHETPAEHAAHGNKPSKKHGVIHQIIHGKAS